MKVTSTVYGRVINYAYNFDALGEPSGPFQISVSDSTISVFADMSLERDIEEFGRAMKLAEAQLLSRVRARTILYNCEEVK
jgi:hypothetical protein